MSLTIEQLDGTYLLQTSAVGGPHPSAGYEHLIIPTGARALIENGMSYSKHPNGFIWETQFAIIGADTIEMISTVDPSHADADAFVADEKGNLTKSLVTYRTQLDVREENSALVLSGEIVHAGGVTQVTFTKIS